MVVGVDSAGYVEQLGVELFPQLALLGDDAVDDARLIAHRTSHIHLGTSWANATSTHLTAAIQRHRLFVIDEKRVEPQLEHLFLYVQQTVV